MGLSQRYDDICRRIEQSKLHPDHQVTLIAVSKTVPVELIRELYDLGHRDFGESRYQEAEPKIRALPGDIRWHFIGALQSNKIRKIGEVFHSVHTLCQVDHLKEFAKLSAPIDVCLEVNTGREAQKSGVFSEGLDNLVSSVLECQQVRLRGLMTIGPLTESSEETREAFRQLAQLRSRYPWMDWLSMGMSQDFEMAIQEGASHVRVGSALFGDRKQ